MKFFKTWLLTIGVLSILMSLIGYSSIGCLNSSDQLVEGSGKLNTGELDYSDFTGIEAGYAFEVEIDKSDSFSLEITLDDNLFDYLDTHKTGDTLYIGLKPNINYRNTTQKAIITMPALRNLELHGASKGDVRGFSSADSLDIEATGASRLFLDNIEAGDTEFEISGASRVSGIINIANGEFILSGASRAELGGNSGGDVSIDASGASTVTMGDFTITNAIIELSGASHASLNVNGILNANLSGASSLEYSGNPTLDSISMSGESTIHQM